MRKQLAVVVMLSLVAAGVSCGGKSKSSGNKPKVAKKTGKKGGKKGGGKKGAGPGSGSGSASPAGEGQVTLEAPDKHDPSTFVAYTYDPAKRLPKVTGAAGYKALGKTRTVRIGIGTWPGFAPIVFANKGTKPKEVWKDAKGGEFLVELVVVDDSVKMTDQIAAGELHASWSTVDMLPLLMARLMRDPRAMPRVVQQIDWSNGGDAIVARDPVKTVADLKGKTVVLAQSSPAQYMLFSSLLDAGLQPSEVTTLFARDPFIAQAAYTSARHPALVTWAPMVYDVTKPGMPSKAVLTSSTDNELIAHVWFARADFARDQPEIVEALVRGFLDAARELDGDDKRAKAAQMLDTALKLPAGTTAQIANDAHWTGFADNKRFLLDRNNPARFERTYVAAVELFKALKVVNDVPKFDQIVDPTVLRKLDKEPRYSTQTSNYEVHHVPVIALREEKGVIIKTFRVAFAPSSSDVAAKIPPGKDGGAERPYDPDADATLETVARIALQQKGSIVKISGYADASLKGKVDEQQVRDLTQSRAYAVRELLGKYKIDPERFSPLAGGWDKPADSDDVNNHVKNRRVEIEVVPAATN